MKLWRWLRGHQATIGFLLLAAGNVAGWQALEAERHDRCVEGRRDVRDAIVAAVGAARPDEPGVQRAVTDAVTAELDPATCP